MGEREKVGEGEGRGDTDVVDGARGESGHQQLGTQCFQVVHQERPKVKHVVSASTRAQISEQSKTRETLE